jgi:hypothetical protein
MNSKQKVNFLAEGGFSSSDFIFISPSLLGDL